MSNLEPTATDTATPTDTPKTKKPRSTKPGTCTTCGQTFSKAAMPKHLADCLSSPPTADGTLTYLVLAADKNRKDYWMILEIPAAATLEKLDGFLRHMWVECCGHISLFQVDDTIYSSYPEPGERGLKSAKLQNILHPGVSFTYDYDMGETTELQLKVLSTRLHPQKRPTPRILAQNVAPAYTCVSCGKEAANICPECSWDGPAEFCDDCAENHECGEDMLLPIVNSPRFGMCGYTG